jgi:type VI secretion system VgrG family protein
MSEELLPHVTARLESADLTGDEIVIKSIRGAERISRMFELEIVCTCPSASAVSGETLLNKATSVAFYVNETELRRIHGTVSRVRDHAEAAIDEARIVLTFVPRAYPAGEFETLDVFLDKSWPHIVEAVLTRSRLSSGRDFSIDDVVGRSAASEGENGSKDYSCIEYTVQYKETNLAFVSRLCEHLGIFYFFDADGMMVFGDANSAFPAIERTPEVQFLATSHGWSDRVTSLDMVTRNLPAKYVMRDYNWRNPGLDMMGQAEVIADGVGQIVEYGGHFKTPEQGDGLAEIRAQELRATRHVYSGTSTVPSFTAGGTFMLLGHPLGDLDLLITEVVHDYGVEGVPGGYRNTFKAIARETQYRPPRITPKPRVDGSLTGIVQGGSGTEFGEIDGQGRYRVKFMFDTAERGDGQASRAVRMAQPSAGGGQGFSFPLRAGVEVILTCIDGDPDRPIITGAVPNPSQPSPTSASNPNKNVIKTSKNQIEIDDDLARVKLTTNGHGTELQLGEANEPNEGYILKTASDGVGTAGKAIGSVSPLVSTMAEYRQSLANKNIVAAAGPPNPLAGWAKFSKFAGASIDFAAGAIGTAEAAMGFVKTSADAVSEKGAKQVTAAKDAVIKSELGENAATFDPKTATRTVKDANGNPVSVTETEAQFRERQFAEAMAVRKRKSEAAAAANNPTEAARLAKNPPDEVAGADAVDLWWLQAGHGMSYSGAGGKAVSDALDSASKSKWLNVPKSVVGTAKAIKDTSKALKDLKDKVAAGGALWGKAIDLSAKASQAKEFIAANARVAGYKKITGNSERHRHEGLPVMQPYNIQASSHSMAIYGSRAAWVFGVHTGIYGALGLGLKAGRLVQISSQSTMELATKNLYVSVLQDSDTKIQGKLISKVVQKGTFDYDDELHTTVKKLVKLESQEDKIDYKAKKGFVLDGGDIVDAKAKEVKWIASEKGFEVDAAKDFWVKSKKDGKIETDKSGLFHGKEKFTGKSDNGGIDASKDMTKLWQQETKIEMKSASITEKTSAYELKAASKADFAGGGGKISLKSRKVFLG